VSCNDAGRVTSIVASRGGLAGVLHESDLSRLSFLAELDLSFNSLTTRTGHLPLLPTPLQHLRSLNLRSNLFYVIPEGFFAGFPALETITLDDNPMAAPQLRFDVLTFSGSLRSFSANNISLLNTFPDYFGNPLVFPVLETLSLARNQIGPTIPASFGNNSKIKYLDISSQHTEGSSAALTGRIDQFIPGMKSLVEVRMDHNSFIGPLPDATNLVNLRVFSAAGNNLCGVPKFASGVSVDLSGNPLVGTPC
jgi:Leucine-rich repeat (LRR) protein